LRKRYRDVRKERKKERKKAGSVEGKEISECLETYGA
jgi:hypothetical protein